MEIMAISKKIEALLLLENKAKKIEEIAALLKCDPLDIESGLHELEEKYRVGDHGIEIVYSAQGVMLLPQSEVWSEIAPLYMRSSTMRMSDAACETLAIIAYSQPITAAEIEKLRGVRAQHSIQTLLEQGLIVVAGLKKAPGTPKLYATTEKFLQAYNLSHINELPELNERDRLHFLPRHAH